jgi:DNA adenine methylase
MKYMGSKASIAGGILPFIHSYIMINNISTYIEPFVGGANMIDKVQCNKRFGYDKNRYIIALFKYLQNGGELPETVSREQYADCRAHYKKDDGYYEDWYLAAVGFLAGFNGRFYDGCYANPGWEGEHYRDYYQESKRNILSQMSSLKDVEFNTADYKTLNPHNSLVYADPPYAGTKGYLTITKQFNHQEFWDIMREWSKDNIVLISEENAPDDFDVIWEARVARTIRANDKSEATEKLFIHSSLNKGSGNEENAYDF